MDENTRVLSSKSAGLQDSPWRTPAFWVTAMGFIVVMTIIMNALWSRQAEELVGEYLPLNPYLPELGGFVVTMNIVIDVVFYGTLSIALLTSLGLWRRHRSLSLGLLCGVAAVVAFFLGAVVLEYLTRPIESMYSRILPAPTP
jgi:hypothetical protein